MIYAPIAICTLNRYEHFRRCIESLEKNPWSIYTDIFISVDFPSNEKHKEGYEKIIEYLSKCELHFKQVYSFFQKRTLGANENYNFIINTVFARYDRIIVLEDDLEVSPNYLEYMDKALAYGENKDNIFCVCGLGEISIKKIKNIEGSVFFAQFISAGGGFYRNRIQLKDEVVSKQWLDEISHSCKKMLKLYFKHRQTFYFFLENYIIQKKPVFFLSNGELANIDITLHIYMIMSNMYAILPTKPKVRNWGYDGTGQNCSRIERLAGEKQELDDKDNFNLDLEIDKKINRLIKCRYSKATLMKKGDIWKGLLYYCYLKITRRL